MSHTANFLGRIAVALEEIAECFQSKLEAEQHWLHKEYVATPRDEDLYHDHDWEQIHPASDTKRCTICRVTV